MKILMLLTTLSLIITSILLHQSLREIKPEVFANKERLNQKIKFTTEIFSNENSIQDRNLNQEYYDYILTEVKKKLTTSLQLKKLTTEETHNTPLVLIQAARAMAILDEYSENNPLFKNKTNHFYAECSNNDSLATSVRVICYHHIMKINKSMSVPESIKFLAEKI